MPRWPSRGLDAVERTSAIRTHLDREHARARRWDLAWGAGLGAAAVGQGAMAATRWEFGRDVDDKVQAGLYIGAGKALIASLGHLVTPLKVTRVGPATSDPCADLAAAERALRRTASKERTTFWVKAGGTVVLNGAGLLIAGLGYDAWREGIVSTALGVPVGVLVLLTEPKASRRAYVRGDFDGRPPAITWTVDAVHGRSFTGLVARGAF